MHLKHILTTALVCLLAACGGDDDDGEKGGRSGDACITKNEDGSLAICTLYAGSGYKFLGMDLLCNSEGTIQLERASSCPTGQGYVGRCERLVDTEQEVHVYYYLDARVGDDTTIMRQVCEESDGSWFE